MSKKEPLKVIAGTPDRPLVIGNIEIPCYVLEDETRVLVQRGMMDALDMKQGTAGRGGGDRLSKFVRTKALKSFVSEQLADVIKNPIIFQTQRVGKAYGYEATIIADLCDAVLEARKAGVLHYQQQHIATRCEILVRAFAKVGIVALVDEATGYQEIRNRRALHKILDLYLAKELAAWAKTFPDEFYLEICRLKGWPSWYAIKRPSIVGKYTNDLVYDRLAPGLLSELRRRNPMLPTGFRKHKHHQHLTHDYGQPRLKEHLLGVTALLRAAPNWGAFHRSLERAYTKLNETIPLPFDED